MVSFEIYTKEIEVEEANGKTNTYRIKPLSGRFLTKIYGCVKKLNPKKEEEGVEGLNEDAMEDLHEIILETFKSSYPEANEEELDLWVAQNLQQLVEPVFEVNLGKPNEK